MREAVRLDAPGSKTRMRVFGRDAAEIVPHVGDDARNLGVRKLGKGAANVASGMFGDAQKWANAACQRTAEGGSAIEGQKLEPGEQRGRCTGLQTIGEPGRPNRKVNPGWFHCPRPIAQRA